MTDRWTPIHPLLDPFRELTPDDHLISRGHTRIPGVLGTQAPDTGINDLFCSGTRRGPIGISNDNRAESDLFRRELQRQRDSLHNAIITLRLEVRKEALARKQTWDETSTGQKALILLGAALHGLWEGLVPDVDLPDDVIEVLQAGWKAFKAGDFIYLSHQAEKLWHKGQAKLAEAIQVLSLVLFDPVSRNMLLDFCAYYAKNLGIVETVHATTKAAGAILFTVAATLAIGMAGVGLAVAIQGSRVLASIGKILHRIAQMMARFTGRIMKRFPQGGGAKKNRQISGRNAKNNTRANNRTKSQTPSQLSGQSKVRQEDADNGETETTGKTATKIGHEYDVPDKFDEIYSKAPAAKSEIDSIADKIAEMSGGQVAKAPIKSQERAIQKIMNDYGGDTTKIKDLARNTIIVSPEKMDSVVAELSKRGANIKVIDGATDPLGYSGINSTIKTQAGIIGEVQVNTPAMIYAKESETTARALLGDDLYNSIASKSGIPGGQGHELYEQWRNLPESGTGRSVIEAQSKDYYDAVRRSIYGN